MTIRVPRAFLTAVYCTFPMMSVFTLPPDLPVCIREDMLRLQIPVSLIIPFLRNPGCHCTKIIKTTQDLCPTAVGAAFSGRSVRHRSHPFMPFSVYPPNPSVRKSCDFRRINTVLPIIPFYKKFRISGGKVVESRQELFSGTVNTAMTADPAGRTGKIGVSLSAFPPHFPGTCHSYFPRSNIISLKIPFGKPFRHTASDIIYAWCHDISGTIRAAGSSCTTVNGGFPTMSLTTFPPDFPDTAPAERFRFEIPVLFIVPFRKKRRVYR